MRSQHGTFGAFDFFKLIDRLRLAVLRAANALGKEILNVRFGHKGAVRFGGGQ